MYFDQVAKLLWHWSTRTPIINMNEVRTKVTSLINKVKGAYYGTTWRRAKLLPISQH